MPHIILQDGNKIEFKKDINGFEIAEKISKSLAKEACIMSVDGVLKDLSFSIKKNVKVKIITQKQKRFRSTYQKRLVKQLLSLLVLS